MSIKVKGRGRNGNRQVSWLAKLTPVQVRNLRELFQEGMSQAELARMFKISQTTVSNILQGRVYRRVA